MPGSKDLRRWSKSKYGKGWKINQYQVLRNTVCALCFKHMVWKEVSIDHVIPLSAGGIDGPNNAQLAHIKCNNLKGSTDFVPF